jgi:thymidylate kinase
MSFLILEGLDRSGKSSVAEIYKSQGYEVIHMSVPDKKYFDKYYTGPSYLDEMIELLLKYDGKDVVFDRSHYGELIWPHVYNRKPLLTEDDIEELQQWEQRNNTTKILMIDPNTQAHWQRCVDNKEPLTVSQFMQAGKLYAHLAHKYNFAIHQLSDFKDALPKEPPAQQISENKQLETPIKEDRAISITSSSVSPNNSRQILIPSSGLEKLEKANAIKEVLSKPILKRKGGAFDHIEEEMRNFLSAKLDTLLGISSKQEGLSSEDVEILKVFVQRIKSKEVKNDKA